MSKSPPTIQRSAAPMFIMARQTEPTFPPPCGRTRITRGSTPPVYSSFVDDATDSPFELYQGIDGEIALARDLGELGIGGLPDAGDFGTQ